jgi:hypothetical protein
MTPRERELVEHAAQLLEHGSWALARASGYDDLREVHRPTHMTWSQLATAMDLCALQLNTVLHRAPKVKR